VIKDVATVNVLTGLWLSFFGCISYLIMKNQTKQCVRQD